MEHLNINNSRIKRVKIRIFHPAWIKVYGIPYSAGYGNNLDIMEMNFVCTVSAEL